MYKTNQKQIKGIDWEKKKIWRSTFTAQINMLTTLNTSSKNIYFKWYRYKIREQDI